MRLLRHFRTRFDTFALAGWKRSLVPICRYKKHKNRACRYAWARISRRAIMGVIFVRMLAIYVGVYKNGTLRTECQKILLFNGSIFYMRLKHFSIVYTFFVNT